jgi:hypothetical protein
MLEKEKAIDAVLIATPDHLHAYITILAMKAGKHVYCEKPLTHNIKEARLVARIAKETGVATQMGNHGRSSEGHRLAVEWLKDGAIGAVKDVHAWSGNPRRSGSTWPGEGPAEKPEGLNWDLWLGPRSERPYSGKVAPFVWRWVWDFGNGTMPDMAPHHFDPAFNALELDAPVTMEARTSLIDPDITVGSHLVTYQYAAKGARGPLTLYWYDNGLRPATPLLLDPDDPRQRLGEGDNGLMIVGCPWNCIRNTGGPKRRCRVSKAITPTGCRAARAARRRAATSSTARVSPNSSSSARSRSAPARSSSGTPRR